MDIKAMGTAAALGIIPRRTITRVKVFGSIDRGLFESYLNQWLAERGPAFQLVDIKFNSTTGAGYSALVIYRELEPLEGNEEGNG